MDKKTLAELAARFTAQSQDNRVGADIALSPQCAGAPIFDAPVLGYAAPGDPLFRRYREPQVIGAHYLGPEEWLPGCGTVISFYLPYTREVVESNIRDYREPSHLWLHGRIEGQAFIGKLTRYLIQVLEEAGIKSMSPLFDPRLMKGRLFEDFEDTSQFTCNWSERHAAYAAGLGTFGLSRGLITRHGMAVRLGSLLTEGVFPPDGRDYTGVYDYCTGCGACVPRCPAGAITLEGGKDHLPCHAFLAGTWRRHQPRYGCGKCQVGTPCARSIPVGTGPETP